MNGGIRYVQYPTFGREMEIAQEALSPTAFSVTQTCRSRRHQTARTVSLSFFEESCAACSSLKVEDDIVISVNRYFY
jgi:hypothetical protein